MTRRDPLGRWPLRRIRVRGSSMLPTLADGDVVLARRGVRPRPGDVVVVTWAQRPGQVSIKRVLRAEGGGWFVAGDNAAFSTDSRELGPALVHGVLRCRLWPPPLRLVRPSNGRPSDARPGDARPGDGEPGGGQPRSEA